MMVFLKSNFITLVYMQYFDCAKLTKILAPKLYVLVDREEVLIFRFLEVLSLLP